jgi:hypothetical protein
MKADFFIILKLSQKCEYFNSGGRMHLNTIRSMLNQALRDNAALGT